VGKPHVQTVRDAKTGELYLMYDLNVAGWPAGAGTPQLVYECGKCKGRYPPAEWTNGCPGCAKKAGEKPKKKWTLTEE